MDTAPNAKPTTDKQLPELFALLRPHLAELDAYLAKQVESFEPEIRAYVDYCIDTGGKRIRPSLIFFSGWNESGTVSPDLVKLAAIIEIVHLATLVHDDIMDEADVRRQRATVSRQFGSTTAVLLGDALFSHAVFLSTQFDTQEVCRHVALAMRNVCSGEIMQTMQRGDPDLPLSTYHRVIDLKTAALFEVSCHLGAKFAGGPEGFAAAAGEFGRRLGIAYQIYDDLTDLFGSQEKIGKTLGTDIATGKATLPIILLRDRLPSDESEALRETLAGTRGADIPYWLEKLRSFGIFDEVKSAIFKEIEIGRASIAPYRSEAAAGHLSTLSDLLWNQAEALKSETTAL